MNTHSSLLIAEGIIHVVAKVILMDEPFVHKDDFSIQVDERLIHLDEKVILMDNAFVHKNNFPIQMDDRSIHVTPRSNMSRFIFFRIPYAYFDRNCSDTKGFIDEYKEWIIKSGGRWTLELFQLPVIKHHHRDKEDHPEKKEKICRHAPPLTIPCIPPHSTIPHPRSRRYRTQPPARPS